MRRIALITGASRGIGAATALVQRPMGWAPPRSSRRQGRRDELPSSKTPLPPPPSGSGRRGLGENQAHRDSRSVDDVRLKPTPVRRIRQKRIRRVTGRSRRFRYHVAPQCVSVSVPGLVSSFPDNRDRLRCVAWCLEIDGIPSHLAYGRDSDDTRGGLLWVRHSTSRCRRIRRIGLVCCCGWTALPAMTTSRPT